MFLGTFMRGRFIRIDLPFQSPFSQSVRVKPCVSDSMHLQCISKALLHTLMHCVPDSACYTTLHHPLHPHLHTCHLHLFVCLFAFVTGTCVACFVCLFPLLDWFR